MGYLKTLLSKDIIVTPFRVHKQFSYTGTPLGYNSSGVSMFNGQNVSYPLGGGEEGTGSVSLVYNSIKQLYYSNYISGSGKVSNINLPIKNSDGTIIGSSYNPNYINNIQSIDELRYFPTSSNDYITVLSIPSKQFGEYIKPGSFSSSIATDDGQGNLLNNSSQNIGNIIYEAGLAIYTGIEGVGGTTDFNNPQWESTLTIYETQYKCTIRANEYNYSLNPSLLSASIKGQNNILLSGSAQYSDFVTSSDFSPYVTTVGLYDDEQNLLAVAKLAQPLPTSQTTDTTIIINIDR
jgi:hypothetical protein